MKIVTGNDFYSLIKGSRREMIFNVLLKSVGLSRQKGVISNFLYKKSVEGFMPNVLLESILGDGVQCSV